MTLLPDPKIIYIFDKCGLTLLLIYDKTNSAIEISMSALLMLFPIDFEPCRPEKLLSLHRSFATKQMKYLEGFEPSQKTSRGFRLSSTPIETLYIFMIVCLEVYQNNQLLNLFLSKNCSNWENAILNEFIPF